MTRILLFLTLILITISSFAQKTKVRGSIIDTKTKENIPLLQILDAIRNIKKIPDASIELSCKRFFSILIGLSVKDKSSLVRLALKYPPVTRALLGAMLEQLQQTDITRPLFKSLNPITKYKLIGVSKVLSTTEKWNLL